MTEFNDLQLDKWQTPLEPERGHAAYRAAAIIVVVLGLVAAAYYLLWRRAQPPPADVRVHTEQAVAPGAAKPVAEPAVASDLPPLAESDPIVRELVGKLSSHASVAAWLTTDNLIRNFTVVVSNVASGRTPARFLTRVKPTGSFQAIERGTDVRVDPRSYRRYDGYADAFAALDAQGAARLYATLKPRIADAYRELGTRTVISTRCYSGPSSNCSRHRWQTGIRHSFQRASSTSTPIRGCRRCPPCSASSCEWARETSGSSRRSSGRSRRSPASRSSSRR